MRLLEKIKGFVGHDFNDHGQIVGHTPLTHCAAVWREDEITLIDLPRGRSSATHINNAGEMVCYVAEKYPSTSFLVRGGVVKEIPQPHVIVDLNEAGVALGATRVRTRVHPVLWTREGVTELEHHALIPNAISQTGVIVGTTCDDSKLEAVVLAGDVVTVLTHPTFRLTEADDINKLGHVLVHASPSPNQEEHWSDIEPAIWKDSTLQVHKAPFPGWVERAQFNDNGVIVACYAAYEQGKEIAVAWVEGEFIDLSDVAGEELTAATAINNDNIVLCSGPTHSYLIQL